MFPPALFTVSTPSATVHFAADLSRTDTHSSRFLPSNSTIASEGAAVQVAPGVTTFGTGCQTSVSSGFGLPASCAETVMDPAMRTASARDLKNGKRIILDEDTLTFLWLLLAGRSAAAECGPRIMLLRGSGGF